MAWSKSAILSIFSLILVAIIFFGGTLLGMMFHLTSSPSTDLFFIVSFFLFSGLALVFGIKALREIKTNPALKGKILAYVGIIIGGLLILFFINLYAFQVW